DLTGANLRDATLKHAYLDSVDLTRADLRGADLACAFLLTTILADADLRGANMLAFGLQQAHLRGARYDETTRWPTHFNPARAGCLRVDAEPTPSAPPGGRGNEVSADRGEV